MLHCSSDFLALVFIATQGDKRFFTVIASAHEMDAAMELTLYLPGLLLPEAIRDDSLFDLTAPALSLLLGRGQRHQEASDWLAQRFGLNDPLPAAALRKIAAQGGISEKTALAPAVPQKVGAGETAAGTFLCLDPVHWQVGRENITLTAVSVDAAEAEELLAALQPLFADWGELSASAPGQWELMLQRSLLLDTQALPVSLGRPVDAALPGGPDGPAWRRLITEAQTRLHAHPVNRHRELRGAPAINSLWPWGAGHLAAPTHSDFSVVWSADAVLAGLCAAADTPCLLPPPAYLPASGAVLCLLDQLEEPARRFDALAWRAALQQLDNDWIAPAMAALKKGECQALRLVGTDLHANLQATPDSGPRCVTWSLVRGNLWRFWRRPLPLTTLT